MLFNHHQDHIGIYLNDSLYRLVQQVMSAFFPGFELEYYGRNSYVLVVTYQDCYYAIKILEHLGGKVVGLGRAEDEDKAEREPKPAIAPERHFQFKSARGSIDLVVPSGQTPVRFDYVSPGIPATPDTYLKLCLSSDLIRFAAGDDKLRCLQLLSKPLKIVMSKLSEKTRLRESLPHMNIEAWPLLNAAKENAHQLPSLRGKAFKERRATVKHFRQLLESLRSLSLHPSTVSKRLATKYLKLAEMNLDICFLIKTKRYPADFWSYMADARFKMLMAAAAMVGTFRPKRKRPRKERVLAPEPPAED